MIKYNKKLLKLCFIGILVTLFLITINGFSFLIVKAHNDNQDGFCINPLINFALNIAVSIPISILGYLSYKIFTKICYARKQSPLRTICSEASMHTLSRQFEGLNISCSTNKKLNILIVDDSAVNRKLLKEILERLYHTVTLRVNGEEAVNIILQSPENTYDLIFMDIDMPIMNGIEASKQIRTKYNRNVLPIIACTSRKSKQDIEAFQMAEINYHIVKPITPTKISEIIQQVLLESIQTTQTNIPTQAQPELLTQYALNHPGLCKIHSVGTYTSLSTADQDQSSSLNTPTAKILNINP